MTVARAKSQSAWLESMCDKAESNYELEAWGEKDEATSPRDMMRRGGRLSSFVRMRRQAASGAKRLAERMLLVHRQRSKVQGA